MTLDIHAREAKAAYRDAYADLRLNGFVDCSKEPPKGHAHYHFIDASGNAISGYFTGKLPVTGEFAVGDINDGCSLKGIHAVLCKPMTAEELNQ